MKYYVADLDKRFCDIDPDDNGIATLRWFIMNRAKEYGDPDPESMARRLKTMTDEELTEIIELYDYLDMK